MRTLLAALALLAASGAVEAAVAMPGLPPPMGRPGVPATPPATPPAAQTPGGRVTPPPSTLQPIPAPSSTLASAVPAGSTVSADAQLAPAPGTTLAAPPAPASTVYEPAVVVLPAAPSATVSAGPVVKFPSDDELHKRTVVVSMPSAYAAHYGGGTGANLNIFMAWYIGTFYNEQGLLIAPISTLLLGGDAKWAFLEDRGFIPALAAGYYGGLALPFLGGAVRASTSVQLKQTDFHNVSMVMGKKLGPITVSGGALYGIKRAFPRVIPMLRNASYTKKAIPQSLSLWTAYAGLDFAWREQHFKLEVLTLPEEKTLRPWLIQTHIDGFLGFDVAYLRDAAGFEVVGYYQISFFRWPDKRRLEKEREKVLDRMAQQQ